MGIRVHYGYKGSHIIEEIWFETIEDFNEWKSTFKGFIDETEIEEEDGEK